MKDFYGVVMERDGGRSLVSWHESMEAAKSDAAKRSSSDTTGTARFVVFGAVGYYGKPITPPQWHDINETPIPVPEPVKAR